MPNIPDSYIFESQLNRNVNTTEDMESTLGRGVSVVVELESTLTRTVSGADADVDPEVKKEYKSFMNQAAMDKVQYDVLNQDLSKNPYFDQFLDDLENAALRTRNQTIIKAINEIYTEQKKNLNSVYNSMVKFNTVIGDLTIDPALKEEYRKIGAKNIYSALVQFNNTIGAITDFVKGNEEDMAKWDQLGYNSIVESLDDIAPSVQRISDLIANLSDEELAAIFSSETADVKEAIENLQNQINELGDRITQEIEEVTAQTHTEVEQCREDLIARMGKWGTLNDSELTVMLNALNVEKTETSDGVQVVHTIVDKYANLLEEFDKVEREIEEAIGSMGAWGNMTTENAKTMLLALGIVVDDPTGVDVLCNLVAQYCETLDEIDTFQAAIDEVKAISEEDAAAVAQLRQDFESFQQYINERFQILAQEVYTLMGAWGQLTHEEAKEIIESLGETAGDNATGIQVIQTLGRKYVALNAKMDDFAAHMDELVSDLVDDYCDPKIQSLAEAIAENFDAYKEEIHAQIEYILSAIDDAESGTAIYEALKAYLNTELAKRDKLIANLNNRVSSVEIIVDAVSVVNERVAAEVDEFGERLDNYSELLNAIAEQQKSDHDSFNDRITTLEDIVDNIPGDTEAQLEDLEQRVSTNEEKIASVEATTQSLSDDLGTTKEKVTDLETDIDETKTQINQQFETVNNEIQELDNKIIDNQGEINESVNTRLTTLEELVDDVRDYVDEEVSTQLEKVNERIDTVEREQQAQAQITNERLTVLEGVAEISLTVNDICSEQDIRNMFEKDEGN